MACKRLLAEGIGSFWLVLGGVGAAVLSEGMGAGGIGSLGIALAFGLSLVTMGFAIGPVSGCHLNPAVTIGLVAGKRFEATDALGYIIAQVVGAVFAGWVLTQILGGHAGFDLAKTGLFANGYDDHSPGGFNMHSVLIAEIVLTAVFMFIIMCTAGLPFAPIAMGMSYALIHLISLNIDHTGINPARSTASAVLQQGWAIDQLWLFWAAPVVGAVLGAFIHRHFTECGITTGKK